MFCGLNYLIKNPLYNVCKLRHPVFFIRKGRNIFISSNLVSLFEINISLGIFRTGYGLGVFRSHDTVLRYLSAYFGSHIFLQQEWVVLLLLFLFLLFLIHCQVAARLFQKKLIMLNTLADGHYLFFQLKHNLRKGRSEIVFDMVGLQQNGSAKQNLLTLVGAKHMSDLPRRQGLTEQYEFFKK